MRKGQSVLEQLARGPRKDVSNGKQGHFTPRPGIGGVRHPLRPPVPEGANADPQQDFIPIGRRNVRAHPSQVPHRNAVPASLKRQAAMHAALAKQVAGGLRSMSFKRVAQQSPGVGER